MSKAVPDLGISIAFAEEDRINGILMLKSNLLHGTRMHVLHIDYFLRLHRLSS